MTCIFCLLSQLMYSQVTGVNIIPSSLPGNSGGFVGPNMQIQWSPPGSYDFRKYCVILYKADTQDYRNSNEVLIAIGPTTADHPVIAINSNYLDMSNVYHFVRTSSPGFEYNFGDQKKFPTGTRVGIVIGSYHYKKTGYTSTTHNTSDWRWEISGYYYHKTVTIDNSNPTPSQLIFDAPQYNEVYYTTNKEFSFTFSNSTDIGSGIQRYFLQEKNSIGSWITNDQVYHDGGTIEISKISDNTDSNYKFRIIAEDNVCNRSYSDEVSIQVDTISPQISLSAQINGNPISSTPIITDRQIEIRAEAADFHLDSDSYDWNIVYIGSDGLPVQVSSPGNTATSVTFVNPGLYQIHCTVKDLAGNESKSATLEVTIDNSAPIVEAPTLTFGYNPTDQITRINLSWEKSQDLSGISEYTVWYRTKTLVGTDNFGNFMQVPPQNVNTDMCTTFLDLSGGLFSREEATEIQFTVLAVDGLGNTGSPDDGNATTIILPAKVESEIRSSSYDSESGLISVAVDFSITRAQAIRDYEQLVLVRTACDGKTALPAESELPREVVISNSDFATKLSDSGSGCSVIDQMTSVSGVGHKYLKYQVYGVPKGQAQRERYDDTTAHLLPNTPGRITWSLIDTYGEVLDFDASGRVVTQNPAFRINGDGLVNVRFRGEDLDKETWMIDLYHSRRVHTNPPIISSNPVSPTSFRAYDTALSPDETYPVYLQGGVNTLLFKWIEGNVQDGGVPGANWAENRSGLFTLELIMEYGQYRVNITNEYAEWGEDWITVQPGEPLTMEIETEDGSGFTCDWEFGDGETASGLFAEHSYAQREDEMSDTSHYTLTIRLTDSNAVETNIPFSIHVLDTQVGQLYISESWRGDHRVIGVVTVPSGLTLTIGDEALKESMNVTFVGNSGSGYLQGIEVLSGGELVVDNFGQEVTFSDGETENGWGTIFISTGARGEIRGAVFRDAERALTIASGAQARVIESVFSTNKTALHIFGGNVVHIEDCQIIENSLYGIKEEQSATPVLNENTLRDNFRTYYRWDGGLLNISEINALPNNDGNKEE